MSGTRTKVVLGNIGLDGHELGLLTVASALRDAGMEVIYLGLCQTPEHLVSTVLQEDADVLGVGSMSGIHDEVIPRIVELMRERGAPDVAVIAGGVIPRQDVPDLLRAGVKAVFGPGTPTRAIVECVHGLCP